MPFLYQGHHLMIIGLKMIKWVISNKCVQLHTTGNDPRNGQVLHLGISLLLSVLEEKIKNCFRQFKP